MNKMKITPLLVVLLTGVFSAPTFAGTAYWDIDGATAGGSGTTLANGTWDLNTTPNWSTSAAGDVATDTLQTAGGATPDVVFSAGTDVNSTSASVITLSGSVSANSLTIEEGKLTILGLLGSSPTLTLGGGGITIASTSVSSTTFIGGPSSTTSSINLILSADQTWNIATGRTLETSHNLFTVNPTTNPGGNNTVKLSGSANLTINADPTAAGSVILGDDLGLTDYTGNITVLGGSLSITSDGNTLTSKSSAGTGTITLGDTSGSRNATLMGGANASKTYTNPIVVAGGSTGNTLTLTTVGLSNSPSFSGGITLNHDLSIAHAGASGSLNITGTSGITTNGYTITTSAGVGTGTVNISTAISGSGALVVNGKTTLLGLNTGWTGPITVSAGNTLSAGAATSLNTLGSGSILLGNGSLLNFASNESNGSDYQNGTVTIASGTASVAATGGSGRIRAIGNLDLGTSGTGATLSVDPTVNNLSTSGVRMLGNSTINVSPTGAATGTFNVYGGVSNSGGNYSLTKTGTGSLILGASTTATVNVTARTGVASTYGGDTNIEAGSIRVGMNNALPTGTTVKIANGAVLDLSVTGSSISIANFSAEIAGLSDLNGGGGTVTANSLANNLNTQRTLTLSGSGNYAFSGNIVNATGTGTGSLAVAKTGSGTQTLSGTNTYTGSTSVSNGTLLIGSSGSIANTTGISVMGGNFRYDGTTALDRNVTLNGGKFSYNSANNYLGTLTYTSGTIGGSNISNLNLSIGTGQTMSPGNSTGTMAAGNTTWATGGTFLFELNDTTGTAGSTSLGWDLLNAATLDITAGAGQFTIQIASLNGSQVAGNALNFDGTSNYTWLFVDTGSAITGFNAASFILDDSAFTNTAPGTFSIIQGSGGDIDKLYINYAGVIPEPSIYAMLLGGLGLLGFLRRRNQS